MKALLSTLALSALALTNLTAQNLPPLSPYFKLDVEEDRISLQDFVLEGSDVTVDIAGVIADVTVTQTYVNNTAVELDAEYVFPGSSQSAVYAMQMKINERVINAVVKEKEEAKQIFQEAKEAGKSASLMQQQRPNVFQMNLANIKPGDSIRVRFSYTENIIPRNKQYEFVFPTIVGPRYGNEEHVAADPWIKNPYTDIDHPAHAGLDPSFAMKLNLNAGLTIQDAICYSHSNAKLSYRSGASMSMRLTDAEYEKNKGDVIFRYRLAGDAIDSGMLLYEHDDEKFFMMTMQPPERPAAGEIPPRDYLFIVDVSGSMNGFPITISKELMRDLLSNLRSTDRFNVLLFASGFGKFSNQMVPVSSNAIDRAVRFIDNEPGRGGTELLPALRESLKMIDDEGRSTTVVIATDGLVTVEREAMDLIQQNLGEANFFPFGIGRSVNRYLLEALAHVGHSEPLVATNRTEAKKIADEFRTMITTPVLTDVKLDFDGLEVYDVIPKSIPDLFADKPIVVYGKYNGKPKGEVAIKGSNGSGAFRKSIPVASAESSVKNGALRYLWARQNVKILSDYNRFARESGTKQKIIDLGLQYNLLTEFTSFVGVDESRPDKQGKSYQPNMKNPSGSVPEPHEWTLIILGISLLLYLLFTNRSPFGG